MKVQKSEKFDMDTSSTKRRLLLLLELLYNTTDENNPVSTGDIVSYLNEKGFQIDRKTLRSDLKLLISMGYDIIVIKGSPNKYFWGEHTFEVPELKMLLDAVSSARFISETKSKQLTKKLLLLASEEQRNQLKRHVRAIGKTKADNKGLYYIIDKITEAINRKRKISFQYTEYNGRKEKILRNDGEVYVLSPYVLYWNEDYYYVIGYSDKRKKITAFRIDRMKTPKITEEKAVPKPKDFDVSAYANKVFQMFSGEESTVELECDTPLMKYVIDRFSIDVETEELSEDKFLAKVPVDLSPTFYGWVFQFGGRIRIVGPEEAVSGFGKLLNSFERYNS